MFVQRVRVTSLAARFAIYLLDILANFRHKSILYFNLFTHFGEFIFPSKFQRHSFFLYKNKFL